MYCSSYGIPNIHELQSTTAHCIWLFSKELTDTSSGCYLLFLEHFRTVAPLPLPRSSEVSAYLLVSSHQLTYSMAATKYASHADSKLPSCSAAASNLLFRLSVTELLAVAAGALAESAEANDEAAASSVDVKGKRTRFHAKTPPPIAVEAYLKR